MLGRGGVGDGIQETAEPTRGGVQWDELSTHLEGVQIGEGKDKVYWRLEKSGTYTTKSLYRHLLLGGSQQTYETHVEEQTTN
jgi:hypothetical protein